MKLIDYVIITVVALIIFLVIWYLVKNRKKGCSSCKTCSACPYSGQCNDEKKKEEQKNQ
ncbi:MAG: FeoB-associated Cys-rich membrane protein [Clostridia bacterium]